MSRPNKKDTRRPFAFHGVEFTTDNDTQYIGECPDCGKVKFYVNKQSGLWDCKVCGNSGNVGQFLEHMQEQYRAALTPQDRRTFARCLKVPVEALDPFGVGRFSRYFTFLVRDAHGLAVDIRCKPLKGNALSTAGCSTGLLNTERLVDSSRDVPVFIVEGESDAIAVQWKRTKHGWPGVVVAIRWHLVVWSSNVGFICRLMLPLFAISSTALALKGISHGNAPEAARPPAVAAQST
jgi:ribosomal protein L37AE/L43A